MDGIPPTIEIPRTLAQLCCCELWSLFFALVQRIVVSSVGVSCRPLLLLLLLYFTKNSFCCFFHKLMTMMVCLFVIDIRFAFQINPYSILSQSGNVPNKFNNHPANYEESTHDQPIISFSITIAICWIFSVKIIIWSVVSQIHTLMFGFMPKPIIKSGQISHHYDSNAEKWRDFLE